MSKEILCTVASAGNCPYFNLERDSKNAKAYEYLIIDFDYDLKYSCRVCKGKDNDDLEKTCMEIEKLNWLRGIANP